MKKLIAMAIFSLTFFVFTMGVKAEAWDPDFSFKLEFTKDGEVIDICNNPDFKNKIKIKSNYILYARQDLSGKELDYNCNDGAEGYYGFMAFDDPNEIFWKHPTNQAIDIEILGFPNEICELEKTSFQITQNDYKHTTEVCNPVATSSEGSPKYEVKFLNEEEDCVDFEERFHTYTINCVSNISAAKVQINVLTSTKKTPFVGITYNIYANQVVSIANKVYNAGEVIATLTSNEKGYSLSNDLPLGSYYLMQASDTPGYVKDTNKYSLTLTKNGEVANVDIYLDPLPQTAIQDYYLPIGIALMVLALIVNGTIVFKERKKVKKQIIPITF